MAVSPFAQFVAAKEGGKEHGQKEEVQFVQMAGRLQGRQSEEEGEEVPPEDGEAVGARIPAREGFAGQG